jgi:hypothetical protein
LYQESDTLIGRLSCNLQSAGMMAGLSLAKKKGRIPCGDTALPVPSVCV